ncbi:MAG TPA: cytidine deaminase [Thermoplasmata archaeon]|nr:cytidine deaminase [Thermoplasmata archaeon]
MTRLGRALNDSDRELIRVAQDALRRGYDRQHHGVAAAVRTRSGAVFVGLNLDGIHTPCAEPVALGAAITAGDREIESMVAVCRRGNRYPVLSPCGTCRQMLFDYAPKASVIVRFEGGRVARLQVAESLPGAFSTFG